MSLTLTPQHVSDHTKSSNHTRKRLLLSDIAIFSFTGTFAAKAARRHSLKSAITPPTPISPTATMHSPKSPRPKLQRRHGSDHLSFEHKTKTDDDKNLVKQSPKITSFPTTSDHDLECNDLNAGILTSPPAHDDKPLSATMRIPLAQTSPINVTVHAIESDDSDDDEGNANTHSSQVSVDEGGVSYVEYAECHDPASPLPIDASPSVDYKAGYIEQTESTYISPPTFLARHVQRSHSHGACEHSYHALDCISETPSPPTAAITFAHFPFSPNISAMLTTSGSLKKEDNTTTSMSVPKLVLTPPDEEASDSSSDGEVMVDDYDDKGHYVRARGIGHGR